MRISGRWIAAALAAGVLALGATSSPQASGASGGSSEHVVFVVDTPNGGEAMLEAVRDALADSWYPAHVQARDVSGKPPLVRSFEVVTKRAFAFAVEDLLEDTVDPAYGTVGSPTPDPLDDRAGFHEVMLPCSSCVVPGGELVLFPRGTPGKQAAVVVIGDMLNPAAYAYALDPPTGDYVSFPYECLDAVIRNGYRKTSSGYELLADFRTPIYVRQEIQSGMTLTLAMVPIVVTVAAGAPYLWVDNEVPYAHAQWGLFE